MELKEKLIEAFAAFENSLNGFKDSSFHFARKEAIGDFKNKGIPTIKNEEWKYTSLSPLEKIEFSLQTAPVLTKQEVSKYLFSQFEANHFVFVNGVLQLELSAYEAGAKDFTVKNLRDLANEEGFKTLIAPFRKYRRYNNDGLISLNEAYAQNGIFIEIIKNKVIERPIVLSFINDTRAGNIISMPRVFVKVNENAQVQIVENYIKLGEGTSFTNVIIEYIQEENSVLNYYKIQNEGLGSFQVGTTQVNQEGRCVFDAVTVSLSGEVMRNNLNVSISTPYAEAHLYGLSFLNGKDHVDNHTVVDHEVPNCESNELYKSILDDQATAVFNGKIFVRQDAQKTNAYQSSKNILLSNEANAFSKPQLEIWADDVKCSHGHATGQLDKEALFYLKARGIGENTAKAMLAKAFADDIIGRIKIEPLKEYLSGLIEGRFHL